MKHTDSQNRNSCLLQQPHPTQTILFHSRLRMVAISRIRRFADVDHDFKDNRSFTANALINPLVITGTALCMINFLDHNRPINFAKSLHGIALELVLTAKRSEVLATESLLTPLRVSLKNKSGKEHMKPRCIACSEGTQGVFIMFIVNPNLVIRSRK